MKKILLALLMTSFILTACRADTYTPKKATQDKIDFAKKQEEDCQTNLAYQFVALVDSVAEHRRKEKDVSKYIKIIEEYAKKAKNTATTILTLNIVIL